MAEQLLYWYKVRNINLTGFSCERPKILDNYVHFDLTTSDDMKETIVISPILIPDKVPEIQRITEDAAEVLHRKWEDAKAWIDPFTGETKKTERSLGSMYRSFKKIPFDEVVKKVKSNG